MAEDKPEKYQGPMLPQGSIFADKTRQTGILAEIDAITDPYHQSFHLAASHLTEHGLDRRTSIFHWRQRTASWSYKGQNGVDYQYSLRFLRKNGVRLASLALDMKGTKDPFTYPQVLVHFLHDRISDVAIFWNYDQPDTLLELARESELAQILREHTVGRLDQAINFGNGLWTNYLRRPTSRNSMLRILCDVPAVYTEQYFHTVNLLYALDRPRATALSRYAQTGKHLERGQIGNQGLRWQEALSSPISAPADLSITNLSRTEHEIDEHMERLALKIQGHSLPLDFILFSEFTPTSGGENYRRSFRSVEEENLHAALGLSGNTELEVKRFRQTLKDALKLIPMR